VKFQTAQGSVYVVYADGTTERNKSLHVGHDSDDVGTKERSARTLYFSSSAAPLSTAGLSGVGSRGSRLLVKDQAATLVTWRDHDQRWGVTASANRVPFTTTPGVGLYPLELWNRADDAEFPGYEVYRSMHAGNAIVSMDVEEREATAVDQLVAAAAQTAAALTAEPVVRSVNDAIARSFFGRGGTGEDGGDFESPAAERGGYALEATTQARLVEIRDLLRAVPGSGAASGQPGIGHVSDYERDVERYNKEVERRGVRSAADRESMYVEAAPLGGSGRNLFNYGQRLRGIGSRLRSRLSPGETPKPPNPTDYDSRGRRKSRFDESPTATGGSSADVINITAQTVNLAGETAKSGVPVAPGPGETGKVSGEAGAIEGAEAGAAAGPYGAAVGAVVGKVSSDPVGAVIDSNPVTAFTAALVDAGKATYEFARAQEAGVRALADVGAHQAMGTAQLDTGRTLRDIQTAEDTGESAAGLTNSIDKFEQIMQPIDALLTNISNVVSGRMLDLVTLAAEPMAELAKLFNQFYQGLPAWLKGAAPAPDETSIEMLDRVRRDAIAGAAPRWPI